MHFTTATDDRKFCDLAKAVRLNAKDMIPMEGPSGSWCLPLDQVKATPAIRRLYRQFQEHKLPTIIQRRQIEDPTRRVTRRHGPDIVCFCKDPPPVGENQFLVGIALGKPFIQQEVASPLHNNAHEGHGTATDQEILLRHPETASLLGNNLKQRQKSGPESELQLPAKDAAQKDAPPEPSPEWLALATELGRQAEIVVSTLTCCDGDPLVLEEGDILELEASEYIQIKAGSVEAMWTSYDWL